MSHTALQDDTGTLPAGVVRRPDGVFLDARLLAPELTAAVDALFRGGLVLRGLDYPVLARALYGVGPELAPSADLLLRVAERLEPFPALRKSLYRNVKLRDGEAEYFFEPIFLPAEELPDGTLLPERQAQLDFDEFVADMWQKNVRFGLQVAAIRAALAAPKGERVAAALELEPTPAQDARVVELAAELHRSDAPRQRADGTVDLTSFQNRFPQIKQGMRLLQKLPGVPGAPGRNIAGQPLAALAPKDVDFARFAGEGTLIAREPDGEFLVAAREGFLNVDPKSGQVALSDKIISREGVSGRTTGNLELMGAFEEFGDVQELRDVNGSDITVHGDVFGNIHSSGGTIILGRNLVGGKAINAKGDIRVDGVASGAAIQTACGTVTIKGRAESCVISAPRVVIAEASNCEIFADEVVMELAIGCAVAGRSVAIESAGPRKSTEMFVYVVVNDVAGHEAELAALQHEVAGHAAKIAAWSAEHARLNGLAEVRSYLTLTEKLRKGEIHLTPAQVPHLKKVAAAVAPQIKALGQLLQSIKLGEEALSGARARRDALEALTREAAVRSSVRISMVDGEVLVRTLPLGEAAAAHFMGQPKDYKALLRGPRGDSQAIFAGAHGSVNWQGAAQVEAGVA
ncbi:flagellar assembly protein A [Pseudoduganella violaceinigra]|uniref:flagellar assembly protein A n=1 Tax=Pseudoduganella violaceinigra TaxID=246602 RepID=UPI000427871C|nr:flagellar assembly protein A [Pseudoduganella violaceinigra]